MTEFKDLDDLAALKKINADWGRENTDRIRKREQDARLKKIGEIEQQKALEEEAGAEARMGRVFELAGKFKENRPVMFEHDGKKYTLTVTEYRAGSTRKSGYGTQDALRLFITDSDAKKIVHDVSLNRAHDENNWYAGYLDYQYMNTPAGGKASSYKWRKVDAESNDPKFFAKDIFKQLPELVEIEELLKAALKQD